MPARTTGCHNNFFLSSVGKQVEERNGPVMPTTAKIPRTNDRTETTDGRTTIQEARESIQEEASVSSVLSIVSRSHGGPWYIAPQLY